MAGEHDPDFILDLLDMTAEAGRVIETAHHLAEQRGASPIPNRLMLAAFLTEADSYAARAFRHQGVEADRLRHQLIGSVGSSEAKQFPLTRQVCERAVIPIIKRAREIAAGGEVSEEILFKAFCDVAPRSFKQAFKQIGVDLDALGSGINPSSPPHAESVPDPSAQEIDSKQFDEKAWLVLVESARLACLQGWLEIRTPHLFAAMIGDGSGIVGLALRRENINPEDMKMIALDLVPARPPLPDASEKINLGKHAQRVVSRAIEIAASAGRTRVSEEDLAQSFFTDEQVIINDLLRRVGLQAPAAETPTTGLGRRRVLDAFGIDLTEKARSGQLPEIVGRDLEIESALQTLLLTESANPLLVGEAGVGKTAIVEGLARRIAEGNCPQKLRSMRVIELSAGRLVANTRLRGEFEQRIQSLIEEARQGIILFIDEIHTIVGAGAAEDSGPDAGNMLKAALARGELRLIGATTHSEYRRTIGRDRALSRRFQVQMIGPPSREATLSVLSARQKALEEHHGVRITKRAKIAAVDLSGRFILDRQWPAKARDALEWACVVAATKKGARRGAPAVTSEHVAQAVSRQAGIPLERVSTSEMSALATLEDRINRRIIGQPFATFTVVDAIRRGRRGFSNRNRPWGVFLFLGSPGVGKTWMAEVVAEEVYGGSEGLIRFDMGEFTEPHSVARLIGAPPGYVGYDQGAPLVERLRKRPYSLLLFDEIEHAHESVLAVLLRLCSEGTLADSEGNTADARNSIVIMTSNILGSEAAARRPGFVPDAKPLSSEPTPPEIRSLVEGRLPGSLIDRLDAIIRFNGLKAEDLEAIAAEKLREIVSRAPALYGVGVEMNPDVMKWLAEKSASESASARAVLRVVEEQVAAPLAVALAEAQAARADMVRVSIIADAMRIEIVGRAAKMNT